MANQHLASYLALVAGAVNAGGFLAVRQYTSHMSGVVASMSDSLALGEIDVVLNGAAALLSFVCGAATSAVLINLARRRGLASVFALPLILEAGLLLAFGLAGAHLDAQRWSSVSMTVVLLCYIMGLQNAMITKVSKAETLASTLGCSLSRKSGFMPGLTPSNPRTASGRVASGGP